MLGLLVSRFTGFLDLNLNFNFGLNLNQELRIDPKNQPKELLCGVQCTGLFVAQVPLGQTLGLDSVTDSSPED